MDCQTKCKTSEGDGCEAFTLLPSGECILYPRPDITGYGLTCVENKTEGRQTVQNQPGLVQGCDLVYGNTYRDFNNSHFNITSVVDVDSPEDCRDLCSSDSFLQSLHDEQYHICRPSRV